MAAASTPLRDRVSGAREPYRELLRVVRTRLVATREWIEASLQAEVAPPPEVYLDTEELAQPLRD